MSQRPEVTPHSLIVVGEAKPIDPEDFALIVSCLCDVRLPPRRRNADDKTVNVVYIVGTANEGKKMNMDADMQKRLENIRKRIRGWGYTINFLGTFPLDVSSGQPPQPIGPEEGIGGVAGRIRNSYLAVEKVLKKEPQELKIPMGLQAAIEQADVHIFGGQEASPDLEAELPYEPNFFGFFLGTESPVKHIQRCILGQSPGLQVVVEAVLEARRRNEEDPSGTWTGGKILVEWGYAKSHSDWHKELGPKYSNRFGLSTLGYDALDLPKTWFEHVIPELATAQTMSVMTLLSGLVQFILYLCWKFWL